MSVNPYTGVFTLDRAKMSLPFERQERRLLTEIAPTWRRAKWWTDPRVYELKGRITVTTYDLWGYPSANASRDSKRKAGRNKAKPSPARKR